LINNIRTKNSAKAIAEKSKNEKLTGGKLLAAKNH